MTTLTMNAETRKLLRNIVDSLNESCRHLSLGTWDDEDEIEGVIEQLASDEPDVGGFAILDDLEARCGLDVSVERLQLQGLFAAQQHPRTAIADDSRELLPAVSVELETASHYPKTTLVEE